MLAGGTAGEIHSHINLHLDGKQIFQTVQSESYKWQTRNAGSRTGLNIPGNKVG